MESMINLIGDPKYIGPGVWYLLHMKAKEATNDKKIDEFIDLMYMLEEKFSCKNCRKHIGQYIDSHPFDDLKHLTNRNGTRIGMFKWAWLFHNAVNTRIHKPYLDWETVWQMYDEDGPCGKNCEEAGEDSSDNKDYNSLGNKDHEYIPIKDLHTRMPDRRSLLAQGYFMSVGMPKDLQGAEIIVPDNTISFK